MNGPMKQQFLTLPDSKEMTDVKRSNSLNVNIQYLHLMDAIYKLLESHDPGLFVERCASLMASDTHNIALFNSKFLQQLKDYSNMFIILKIFMCYSTWCDCSVVKRLLKVCDCPEGLALLEQFESQINLTLSVTHLSLFVPNFLMIPSETSDFAVMTTQCVQEYSLLSLKYIREVKSLVAKISDLNEISCLFLATRDNPVVLFWLVPRSVIPLITAKAHQNHDHIVERGITFYPKVSGNN